MFNITLDMSNDDSSFLTELRANLMTEMGQKLVYRQVSQHPDYLITDYENDIEYEVGEKDDTDVLIAIADVLKEKGINSLHELYMDIEWPEKEDEMKNIPISKIREYKKEIFDIWISENL